MAINQQAAAGVQALAQSAQGGAQQAAPAIQQARNAAAGQAGGMAGYPGDFGVTPFRPDYADPNEWSPMGDAIALAHKARLQDQNAPGMFLDPGRYMDMGLAQRNAVQTGNYNDITGVIESGNPLLDMLAYWDFNTAMEAGTGVSATGGVGGVGGDGDGGDGDGGV